MYINRGVLSYLMVTDTGRWLGSVASQHTDNSYSVITPTHLREHLYLLVSGLRLGLVNIRILGQIVQLSAWQVSKGQRLSCRCVQCRGPASLTKPSCHIVYSPVFLTVNDCL